MKKAIFIILLPLLAWSCGPVEKEPGSSGCEELECPDHSTCVETSGQPECVCDDGFVKDILGFCVEDICQGTYIILGKDDEDYEAIQDCVAVSEDVKVMSTDLLDLSFLYNLRHVKRTLGIGENASLISLSGLNNLEEVSGRVWIFDNESLKNLKGFDSLKTAKYVDIFDNDVLHNMEGLIKLTTVTYNLSIKWNKSLQTLDGLQSLTKIGGSLEIGATLIGTVVDPVNPVLENIKGLSNLNHIGDSIKIGNNPLLKSLDGLEKITTIEGDLEIESNESLENIDGLKNLTSIGERLYIHNNPNLPCCEIEALIKRLRDNGWEGEVSTGLNKADECGEC